LQIKTECEQNAAEYLRKIARQGAVALANILDDFGLLVVEAESLTLMFTGGIHT